MRDISQEWIRLKAVIEWSGMSINAFSKHIGLSHAETVYRVKRGINGVSRNLAARICTAYPQIDEAWLLCGTGRMLLK